MITLDVTIGKLVVDTEPQSEFHGEEIENGEQHALNIERFIDVAPCPETDENICNPDRTIYPRKSKRSGSSGFWKFWKEVHPEITELYHMMRFHPGSNDTDIALIQPVVEKIRELDSADFDREAIQEHVKEWNKRYDDTTTIEEQLDGHIDRLQWLKHWCETAVDCYGEDAAIRFR